MQEQDRLIVMRESDNTMRQFILIETGSKTIPQGLRCLNQSQIETPILPFGTVLMKKDGTTTIYFIQRPPEKVVIQFKPKILKAPVTNFTIAYPWRVFVLLFKGMVISDYGLRFASKPVRSRDTQLFSPPLPNMDGDAGLCMGAGVAGYAGKEGPMAAMADRVIEWIDKTRYNDDLSNGVKLVPKEMNPPSDYDTRAKARHTFELWQKWTEGAGPRWRTVIDLSWHPVETFGAFVERIK